jgi:hypothetical protein
MMAEPFFHFIDFPHFPSLSNIPGVSPKGNPAGGMAPFYSVRPNPAFSLRIGPNVPEVNGFAPETWTPARPFLWQPERKRTTEQPGQVSKSVERAEALFVA